VKKLHIDAEQAAHRELRIAAELADREMEHVLPFLDAGQDSESEGYFVVMPRADRSLLDALRANGPLREVEAAGVLHQIVSGLLEVPDLVHRDLKPGNVLEHQAKWKVADFGIARFVEESTSANTLQGCLTPEYAAPEQWRLEAVTHATDVYALGCMAHELISGQPPFMGTQEVLRKLHLESAPPAIDGSSTLTQQLVGMMLRKTPAARPTLGRVLELLAQVAKESGRQAVPARPGLSALAQAAAEHAGKEALREAAEAEHLARANERRALAEEGKAALRGSSEELWRRIKEAIPEARRGSEKERLRLYVGPAVLEVNYVDGMVISPDEFPRSKWNVVTGAVIGVEQSGPPYEWNASLWYTNRGGGGDYRWVEVGYQTSPFVQYRKKYEPFALGVADADRAHSPAMDVVQAAYGPLPIDLESFDGFCDRWARILAAASRGQLRYPPDYGLAR
jgi:serine/threonine-protein kinase